MEKTKTWRDRGKSPEGGFCAVALRYFARANLTAQFPIRIDARSRVAQPRRICIMLNGAKSGPGLARIGASPCFGSWARRVPPRRFRCPPWRAGPCRSSACRHNGQAVASVRWVSARRPWLAPVPSLAGCHSASCLKSPLPRPAMAGPSASPRVSAIAGRFAAGSIRRHPGAY